MDLALGLIETKGLVGAIEAADAMVKAADVKIISKEKVTGALIIIKVMGETAAVKSSVDAGAAAAQRVGELIGAHVIPRPDNQIDQLLFDKFAPKKVKAKAKVQSRRASQKIETKLEPQPAVNENIKTVTDKKKQTIVAQEVSKKENDSAEKIVKKSSSKKLPSMDELVILNVHALRRIARGFDEFPIKGREISKANRAKLLDYFKSMQ